MDDLIAVHASDQGHWPGLSYAEIKSKIEDVRVNFQDAHDFGQGRRIFRKGDTILLEDGKGSGTIFRPMRSATHYFHEFIDQELS